MPKLWLDKRDWREIHDILRVQGYEDRSPALPLQTDKITIEKVSPGIHEIGLIPEGRIGGCNTAFLLAWGGTIAVFQ